MRDFLDSERDINDMHLFSRIIEYSNYASYNNFIYYSTIFIMHGKEALLTVLIIL